jgi:hypothetical protein
LIDSWQGCRVKIDNYYYSYINFMKTYNGPERRNKCADHDQQRDKDINGIIMRALETNTPVINLPLREGGEPATFHRIITDVLEKISRLFIKAEPRKTSQLILHPEKSNRPQFGPQSFIVSAALAQADEEKPRVSMEEAKEIIGDKSYFGPEAYEKAFNTTIPYQEIPSIPFSRVDLERARQLGQQLILRVPKINGRNLTAAEIIRDQAVLYERYYDKKYKEIRRVFFSSYTGYDEETVTGGWALRSEFPIPDNKAGAYMLPKLRDYLTQEVFRDLPTSSNYQDLLGRFDEIMDTYLNIMSQNRPKSITDEGEKELGEYLKAMGCASVPDIFYDVIVINRNGGRTIHDGGAFAGISSSPLEERIGRRAFIHVFEPAYICRAELSYREVKKNEITRDQHNERLQKPIPLSHLSTRFMFSNHRIVDNNCSGIFFSRTV